MRIIDININGCVFLVAVNVSGVPVSVGDVSTVLNAIEKVVCLCVAPSTRLNDMSTNVVVAGSHGFGEQHIVHL